MNRYHVPSLRRDESKGEYGSLKHRKIGENFVAYVSEKKKPQSILLTPF